MKRIILAAASLFLSIGSFAQDMIVKKDGTIIQAKVSEIGTVEVKYKKWSNLDGPSYAITKNDILAITYQNGEKETFESEKPVQAKETKQKTAVVLDANSKKNVDAINAINNATIFISDSKLISKNKKTKTIALLYGITNNSILESDDISFRIEFAREAKSSAGSPVFRNYYKAEDHISFFGKPTFLVTLTNNSDRLIYVDLANTFFSIGKDSESYYVPSANTTSTTSSSGASFNLGGITNGLGVGGVLGSLANATTVGGSNGTTTSNVVFSQRVISIPPHTSRELAHKNIEYKNNPYYINGYTKLKEYYTHVNIGKTLCIGEEVIYDETNTPFVLNFYTTLSYDEDLTDTFNSSVTLYCKKALGVEGGSWKVNTQSLEISNNCIFSFGAN